MSLLTVEQVVESLGLCRKTVLHHLAAGRLPGRKIGGRWFVLESALMAALTPAAAPTPAQPQSAN